MLSVLKQRLPWWAKIWAKVMLARVPMAYGFWQRMELFRHGYMDSASYATDVFDSHVVRAGLEGRLRDKTLLEIGPGDSIATAIIACSFGGRAILVDSGPYARSDLQDYLPLCELLRARGLQPPDLSWARTLQDVLSVSGARYLTEGLASWRRIPSASVDFVFSQAVLEHVRKHEFFSTQQECRRVMRAGAIASHRVDLRDHLGGALNNLRFSARIWESPFFVRSGFYTNRVQCGAMLTLFEAAGFQVELGEIRRWPALPTPREALAAPFRDVADDELRIAGFDVLLRVDDTQSGKV